MRALLVILTAMAVLPWGTVAAQGTGAAATVTEKLVSAARDRTEHKVTYDGSYVRIGYPMGDVASDKGVCTDVLIRSLRAVGYDLQKLVHEDMKAHFDAYPKAWGLTKPDTNIDHRRVLNLEVFFKRKGEALPVSEDGADYKPGDIVTWRLGGFLGVGRGLPHIGIVVDQMSKDGKRPLIVHNIGSGPKMEDMLFDHQIMGHFRYPKE